MKRTGKTGYKTCIPQLRQQKAVNTGFVHASIPITAQQCPAWWCDFVHLWNALTVIISNFKFQIRNWKSKLEISIINGRIRAITTYIKQTSMGVSYVTGHTAQWAVKKIKSLFVFELYVEEMNRMCIQNCLRNYW